MATKAADNRYKHVKYNQTKCGASTTRPALAWALEVDWDQDGFFDGVNEAEQLVSFNSFRGRRNLLSPAGQGFEPLETGRITLVLENRDGRYDAWNASSPLYPNVAPGCDIRLRVRDLNGTETPYNVFYGVVTDIIPLQDGSLNRVQLIAEDTFNFLRNVYSQVSVGYGSRYLWRLMGHILDSVGWPIRWGRNIDTSLTYSGLNWGQQHVDAASQLQVIALSSAYGVVFVAADGRLTYKADLADHSVTAMSITQDMLYKDVRPAQPWLNRRSIVKVTAHPWVNAFPDYIWTLTAGAPYIGVGETISFLVPFTYNGVQEPGVVDPQPVPTTDWLTNEFADGSGMDGTANCTLRVDECGDYGRVTVTNVNAFGVYLWYCRIPGWTVHFPLPIVRTYPQNTSLVVSKRELVLDSPWQQSDTFAGAFAATLGAWLANPQPSITGKMSGRPSEQFALELFDGVSVTLAKFGITDEYMRVGGIAMESRGEGCQDILTTLYLEPCP